MLSNDLVLLVTLTVATLLLARLLRWVLDGAQEHPPPHLDARGLLLFAPMIVLLAADAPGVVLVPLMGAVAVYLLAVLGNVLGTSRLVRVVLVIGVAAVLHQYGVRIESVRFPLTGVPPLELGWWLSLAATAAWLLVCAVLFGRAGNIPSVSYGVAALTGLTFYLVCLLVPAAVRPGAEVLALTVLAVALTQLTPFGQVSQLPAQPSSYAMGFLIGALSIVGTLKHTAAIAALLPMLVISVPLFGVTYTYISRLRGMRIGTRRQHLHEVLLEQGYSQRQVFGVLMGISAYMCLLGLLMVTLIPQPTWLKLLVLFVGLLYGPFVGFLVLRMLGRQAPEGERADEINMFNVRLHPLSMDEALDRAESFIREGGPHMIVTSDTSAVVRAQEDEELRTIINEADLATMDGQGVVLCARLLNVPVSCRVPGVDMMERLCETAAELGQPVALLGAAPGVAEEAAAELERRYPGLEVVYTHHGYFAPEEEPEIVADIRDAGPAVLFVAMGIPKQEKWIKRHMDELQVPVCMGVGGSFDVLAGRVQRAPEWMQRAGLEWLYRTAIEPRRLPRLAALPRLFMMTLRTLISSPDADLPARQVDGGKTTD